jgi:hypothetical protein
MGAGVILIEEYMNHKWNHNTQQECQLTLILFRDKHTGKFADAGGVHENGEHNEKCASRELTEESIGLFTLDLTSPQLNKSCVKLASGYVVFLVPIKHRYGINQSLYHHNKNNAASLGDAWSETQDMRRFFWHDILNLILTRPSNEALRTPINDIHGVPCFVCKRTICILQKASARGILENPKRIKWNHLHLANLYVKETKLSTYSQQHTW